MISPVQLLCSPATQRASVVLPEPDSPTTATQVRGGTSRPMPDSTGVLPYLAATPRTDRTGVPAGAGGPPAAGRRSGRVAGMSRVRRQRTERPATVTGSGAWVVQASMA